jgi:hypothetical protein
MLQGILFVTFAVVFVGYFLRLTKTVFFYILKLWSFLRDLYILVVQFSPFPSWVALL